MASETFKLITRQMAVEVLGVSMTTLDALVASGSLPAPKPLGGGRRVYWLPEAFYGYLKQTLGNGELAPASAQEGSHAQNLPVPIAKRRRPSTRPSRSAKRTLGPRLSKRIQRLND